VRPNYSVIALASKASIIPWPQVNEIVIVAAKHFVRTSLPAQPVITPIAVKDVTVGTSKDNIVIKTTTQDVVSTVPIKTIHAKVTMHIVVTAVPV
jgi:hypothetical protein